MTSYLCVCIEVSKSSYYNYLSNENRRVERDKKKTRKILNGYKKLINLKNVKKGQDK